MEKHTLGLAVFSGVLELLEGGSPVGANWLHLEFILLLLLFLLLLFFFLLLLFGIIFLLLFLRDLKYHDIAVGLVEGALGPVYPVLLYSLG